MPLDDEMTTPMGGPDLSDPLNLLHDPGAEEENADSPYWFDGTDDNVMTAGWSYSTDDPHTGTHSLKADSSSNGLKLYNRALAKIVHRVGYYFGGWAVVTTVDPTLGSLEFGIDWLDEDQIFIDDDVLALGDSATYVGDFTQFSPPTGAVYARFFLRTTSFSSGTEFWYVDDLVFAQTIDGGQINANSSIVISGGISAEDFSGSNASFVTLVAGSIEGSGMDADLNTITNIGADELEAAFLASLASTSYVDALLAANDALTFEGVIDCSANPNYPAADAGHVYKVSVAGKIGGASGPNVEAGDVLTCIVDGSASGNHATVGANWIIQQGNIDGAVTGPASSTGGHLPSFNGTSGKVIQDSGVAPSTDGTFAANSDAKLPTEKAVKTYVDTGLATKQAAFTDSAGLRAALSDETGTGAAVFASSPAFLGTPTLTATRPSFEVIYSGEAMKTRVASFAARATHLALNASFDGTNWAQDDATRASMLFNLNCITAGSEAFNIISIAAGSTTPVTRFSVTAVGNAKIGGSANRGTTEGTNQLVIFNGTAPVGTLTNGASFYAASGEMRVMDSAGNSTLLSPHDSKTNEWIYHSKDTRTGKVLRIDMERLMRKLDELFGGGFIHELIESED